MVSVTQPSQSIVGRSRFDVHPPVVAGVDALWRQTLGDSRICVAILDGSANLSLPCFRDANLECGETLAGCALERGASCDHATALAAIIFGGHDRGGVRGIAPGCRGLVLPIFRDRADGTVAPCSQIDLARAISQAVAAGAHVINISAGQLSISGKAHPMLSDVARDCARRGVLIVSAVGNDGCECLHIPGALESVLSVGALDAAGRPLPFSNWGGPYATQGVMAPEERIPCVACDGSPVFRSGTSFATAVVSGIAALLLSRELQQGQRPDPLLVRSAILNTVLKCDGELAARSSCARLLVGVLNVPGAISFLQRGAKAMTNCVDPVVSQAAVENSGGGLSPLEADVRPLCEEPNEPQAARPAMISPRALAPAAAVTERHESSAVEPLGCGCGCNKTTARAQLAYVLGRLGYDYVSLSRRDSIAQHMGEPAPGIEANPDDPAQLLRYLGEHPWDASAITWTLNIEDTPIYAIQPAGPFAQQTYDRLRIFLREQVGGGVDRISVPGYVAGKIRLLMAHMDVPVLIPELRDMYSWNSTAMVSAIVGKEPNAKAEKEAYTKRTDALRDFLDRVYHGFRNLGLLPQDRAVNYAATNAFHISNVFELALKGGRELDNFEVVPSPMCRPDAECWDVKLIFFDPAKQLERARRIYRFTVDVSDVVPVLVGEVRTWHIH